MPVHGNMATEHGAAQNTANSARFLTTFDKDTQYPIYKQLCDNLTGGSVVALSKTCRQFSTLYRDLLPGMCQVIPLIDRRRLQS